MNVPGQAIFEICWSEGQAGVQEFFSSAVDHFFQLLLYGPPPMFVYNSFINAEFDNVGLFCSVTDRLDTWEKALMFFRQLTAKSHIIKMNQVC